MEVAKLLVDLIGVLAWPGVVVGIVFAFRKPIIQLLPRIVNLKAVGVELTIEQQKQVEGIAEEVVDKLAHLRNPAETEMIYQEKETIQEEPEVLDDSSFEAGRNTMLAFTANVSFYENIRYGIYYDPADRNHNNPFRYIGLYKGGRIAAVGRLRKVVQCDLEDGELVSRRPGDIQKLRPEEKQRIIDIMMNTSYYDIKHGCKFFLVDKFFETEFIKSHSYPLRGKKYIWLNNVLGFKTGMDAKDLADVLDGREW